MAERTETLVQFPGLNLNSLSRKGKRGSALKSRQSKKVTLSGNIDCALKEKDQDYPDVLFNH